MKTFIVKASSGREKEKKKKTRNIAERASVPSLTCLEPPEPGSVLTGPQVRHRTCRLHATRRGAVLVLSAKAEERSIRSVKSS